LTAWLRKGSGLYPGLFFIEIKLIHIYLFQALVEE